MIGYRIDWDDGTTDSHMSCLFPDEFMDAKRGSRPGAVVKSAWILIRWRGTKQWVRLELEKMRDRG